MKNKKAFSLVEIIITISIIVLLAVIGVSGKKGYDDNMNNTKVLSDTETINNALESFSQENSILPLPGGNTNYYTIDTTYAHSSTGAYGVYGSLTENTIAKKYLDTLPLDPRTNSYYAYGKTIDTNQFEIASIQVLESSPTSKVIGNYTAENGPYNLIREYNGPNFVFNGSEVNLPYNPDDLILIATDAEGNIYREGDEISTTALEKEIFFSDGSVSILEPNSKITLNKLNFKNDDNLNTIVKLGLSAGKIWTRATKLNDESEFEIYTTDSSAAVRGTIFSVDITTGDTDTIVIEGEVEIEEIPQSDSSTETPIETVKVKKGEKAKKIKTRRNVKQGSTDETEDTDKTNYRKSERIRSDETLVRNEEERESSTSSGEIVSVSSQNGCAAGDEDENNHLYKCKENLEGTEMKLHAIAKYDDNLNLIHDGGYYSKIYDKLNSCPSGWTGGDICNNGTTKGVYLDNDNGGGIDKLKYSGLGLNGDFGIEINVQVPIGDNLKHYLIHSGGDTSSIYDDIKLYIQNGKLWLNPLGLTENIPLGTGFNKIQLIRNGNNILARYNGINTPIKTLTVTVDEILVGNFYNKNSYSYYNQVNSIIDYMKIYK